MTIVLRFSVCVFFTFISQVGFSQGGDGTERDSTLFFQSSISVTQNGFSFIPSFSLGKPAAILNVGVGNERFSFEPEFRFALEGRPWSFIFIYRYKILNKGKFRLTVGGHLPAINFAQRDVIMNGVSETVTISQRFLAGEIAPNYLLSENVSIGMFYLNGYGFQDDATKIAHLLSLRSSFSNIQLTKKFYLRFNPQIYYLKTDDKDGFYTSYSLQLAMKDFPLSISHIVNKSIHTNIPSTNFDWNVSLIYSFHNNYIKR